ncbi:MAG: hypothetical protein R2854_17315 [Caldilineaceae bacterium]
MTNRKAVLPLLVGWLLYSVTALPWPSSRSDVATPVPAAGLSQCCWD